MESRIIELINAAERAIQTFKLTSIDVYAQQTAISLFAVQVYNQQLH